MKQQPAISIGGQELSRYVDQDQRFRQVKLAVARVLAVRKARGNYHPFYAERGFRLQLAKPAAMAYCKEFGHGQKEWRNCFTSKDLQDFGRHYMKWFEAEWKMGNFEGLLPPKLQSRMTRQKTAAAMAVADKQRNHSIGDHVTDEGMRPGGSKPRKAKKAKATASRPKKTKARKPQRGRGGTVPSGAVKPHPSKRKCEKCGRIHTKSAHHSHHDAPKGGKPGAYKVKRGRK